MTTNEEDPMLDQRMARNRRRAVQLFDMWMDESKRDLSALIKEAMTCGDDVVDIVCGLLQVGTCLIEAAAADELDECMERLLGESLLGEALIGDDQA